MKEIKIESTLTNSENETTNLKTAGKYNEQEKYITYLEEDLQVTVYIFNNYIKISRKNDDYNLNLEFRLNEKIVNKYEVKSVGLNIDLAVYTTKLEINENYISVDYILFNEDEEIGNFQYKLSFGE